MKKILGCFAGALLLLGSQAALAQAHEHLYLGVGGGSVEIDSRITNGLITSGTVDAKHDRGGKAFAGLRLGRHLALELGWVDLGDVRYSGVSGAVPVTGGKIGVNGVNGALVGLIPLGDRLELFGKLGAFAWEADAKDQRAGLPFSRKTEATDRSAGLGANLYFARNVGLRVEAERFELDNDNADLVSANLLMRF